MSIAKRRVGLFPGSPSPEGAEEVDLLLRLVPSFVFLSEFDSLLFYGKALVAHAGMPDHEQLERLADGEYVGRVHAVLEEAKERAHRNNDNGLLFLATSLDHFLGVTRSTEHPLLVALYCRSRCRLYGPEDSPAAVAEAMDEFDAGGPDPE